MEHGLDIASNMNSKKGSWQRFLGMLDVRAKKEMSLDPTYWCMGYSIVIFVGKDWKPKGVVHDPIIYEVPFTTMSANISLPDAGCQSSESR